MNLLLLQQVVILPLLGLSTILYTSKDRDKPMLSHIFLLTAISAATASGAIAVDVWFATELNLYLGIALLLAVSTLTGIFYHRRLLGVIGPSLSLILAVGNLLMPF